MGGMNSVLLHLLFWISLPFKFLRYYFTTKLKRADIEQFLEDMIERYQNEMAEEEAEDSEEVEYSEDEDDLEEYGEDFGTEETEQYDVDDTAIIQHRDYSATQEEEDDYVDTDRERNQAMFQSLITLMISDEELRENVFPQVDERNHNVVFSYYISCVAISYLLISYLVSQVDDHQLSPYLLTYYTLLLNPDLVTLLLSRYKTSEIMKIVNSVSAEASFRLSEQAILVILKGIASGNAHIVERYIGSPVNDGDEVDSSHGWMINRTVLFVGAIGILILSCYLALLLSEKE